MAEFSNSSIQIVNPNSPVLLNTIIRCNKGYVIHREGSGIVTLRGIVNNCGGCFARYQCIFKADIAVPTDYTVGPIAVALAISGEPLASSIATVTPAAVDEYNNVCTIANITVPRGCCWEVSVENVSTSSAPQTTPAPAINVRYATLDITRVA